jgi:hypothetical protein
MAGKLCVIFIWVFVFAAGVAIVIPGMTVS